VFVTENCNVKRQIQGEVKLNCVASCFFGRDHVSAGKLCMTATNLLILLTDHLKIGKNCSLKKNTLQPYLYPLEN
jgi:hypothetical protein